MAGGGVEDAYGEDRATEEQLITPWSFSVARYEYRDREFCLLCFAVEFLPPMSIDFFFDFSKDLCGISLTQSRRALFGTMSGKNWRGFKPELV